MFATQIWMHKSPVATERARDFINFLDQSLHSAFGERNDVDDNYAAKNGSVKEMEHPNSWTQTP